MIDSHSATAEIRRGNKRRRRRAKYNVRICYTWRP